jgi:hypothetical protein
MSRRVYRKDHQEVVIESIGEATKGADGDDIWSVTTSVEEGISVRSILYTSEVKELVTKLEEKFWKKESSDAKAT